jgi:hypothetical protein
MLEKSFMFGALSKKKVEIMKRILNQDAELTIRDKIANWIVFLVCQ